ncbi:MAG: hypothetical protein NE330_23355 [Lentisphaeraceae bacterium]|nr:hypothetical protein [Lentisphaeraceae bacterium]
MFQLREAHKQAMSKYMRRHFYAELHAFAEEFYKGDKEDIPKLVKDTLDQARGYMIESQGHIFQLLHWNIKFGVHFENSRGMERCKKLFTNATYSENMRMKLVEGELDAK